MSEHETIKEEVAKLNKHKNNVVTATQNYVKHAIDLGQKVKDKNAAEKILLSAKDSEKYASASIPDLVITHGHTPVTGSVKINHPHNGSQHLFDTDIKLEFETKHIHVPFTYLITGQEKTSATPFLIKTDSSHHDKVLIHSIKEENKKRLSVGTYEITAHIIDPAAKKEIVPPDTITIEVTPRGLPPGKNHVELKSPIAKSYDTTIPIQFKVHGPYHDSGNEYIYAFICKNELTNTVLPPIYGRSSEPSHKEVTHATSLNLTKGEYTAQIKIIEPGPSMNELSHSDPVRFAVDIKNGPGPIPGPIGPTPAQNIINNIVINNNVTTYNVGIPFVMPIGIEIFPNPTHINEVISQPINIEITSAREEEKDNYVFDSKLKDVIVGGLRLTLKKELLFEKHGKYRLHVVLYRNNMKLFEKVIYITINIDMDKSSKEAKLIAIIDEIRKRVREGLDSAGESIKFKIDESTKNPKLAPYIKELDSVINTQYVDQMKSEAEKVMNKKGTTPQIGGVCGALINRANEYQYYYRLYQIFRKRNPENNNDYLQMLQQYIQNKELETILKSINKQQQDDIKKRKPQDEAQKVADLIKTAISFIEKTDIV